MSKHTKGPWYVQGHDVMVLKPEREHLGEGAPETICEMISSVSPEETRCNQALIAAAPDLLEACKSALLLCDGANPSHEAVYHQLNTAINKADLP